MIESNYSSTQSAAQAPNQSKVLKMVTNERLAGSIPSWEKPQTPQQNIESQLTQAQINNGNNANSNSILAYNTANPAANGVQSEEFTFGDLVDMVNPLHHIPVVNYAYREITGDEIKPIGKIVGGAVFGGPLGAASGLVDTVVTHETGKDMAGNIKALAFHQNRKDDAFVHNMEDSPEKNIETALKHAEKGSGLYDSDMTSALLSFSDLGNDPNIVITTVEAADGRTAGSFKRTEREYPVLQDTIFEAREPITQVRFNRSFNN